LRTNRHDMLTDSERKKIRDLMQKEIVPAIGCTEPIAVALCTAKTTEILEDIPQTIEVYLSTNIIKNAMGVGIPGTNMTGLPISIALGALIGKSEYGLEVLKDLTATDVERAKLYIKGKRISIQHAKTEPDNLYIKVLCTSGENKAVAIIRGSHTSFTRLEKNGNVLMDKDVDAEEITKDEVILTFRKVYDYAVNAPLTEIEFILKAAKMNKKVSLEAQNQSYGHNVSKTMLSKTGLMLFGDNLHSRMIVATTGACDVRMDGAMIPVMSNSGSGNQGIASTLPILTFAENIECTNEQLIRALILSSLTMIYIKQLMGRLSPLCGCVIASTGSSCGITYLMGGNYAQIELAAKNMIANITGMICDGAKPSCALKIASGVSTATISAMMAIEHQGVSAHEGIIDEDIDKTIRNMARIGNNGMKKTDKIVLDIMTRK